MKDEISVRKEWFEALADLSDEARGDSDRWHDDSKLAMPASISKLIGYASSARSILAHAPKEEDIM